MGRQTLKISCVLEGDSALDFERLHVTFQVGATRTGRAKQQALLIEAAMLVMEATLTRHTVETGRRYPALADVMRSAGCSEAVIQGLLDAGTRAESSGVGAVKTAISRQIKPSALEGD